MGVSLCTRSDLARQFFEQASTILGFDLLKLCADADSSQLSRTEFSQPALFVHSYAALKQLEAERSELWDSVDAVAGLSLGEYTAVCAAGGISFEDGVRLVQIRGRAMQAAADAIPSAMSSIIGLDVDKLRDICAEASFGPTRADGDFVQVANLLCPGNIAISGHTKAVGRAEDICTSAGAMKAIRLQVAGAFHTPIMQPAVETLKTALAEIEFFPTRVPVFSNVDGLAHSDPVEIKDLLAQQVIAPVLWEASLRNMLSAGVEQFIEIGSGRILAGTLKRIHRKTPCEHFGD